MSGKVKGASAIILNKYSKATYVHYFSHVLNLLIVNECKITLIQNMMGIICIFCKYCVKRQGLLEENITQICVESSKKKLVEVKRDGLPYMIIFEYLSNCIMQYLTKC